MEVEIILIVFRLLKSRDDSFFVSKTSLTLPSPNTYTAPTEFNPKKFRHGVFHPKTPLREYITGLDVPHPLKYSPKFASSIGMSASYHKKNTPV